MTIRDRTVTASPAQRDRAVDAARVAAIVVVLVWHWSLSLTSRTPGGSLAMPNPVDDVAGGWALTWVLQVVPVFVLVGGYAARRSRDAARRRGVGAAAWVRGQLLRTGRPVALWLAAWLGLELAAAAVRAGTGNGPHTWVWDWFPGYLAPLWFLGVYAALTALAPAVAALHDRWGGWSVATLAAAVAGSAAAGATWACAALVWVLVWALGDAWAARGADVAPRRAVAVAGAGLLGLVLLTTVGGYPRSMVSSGAEGGSNLLPTTPAVAALAVLQLGLLLLVAPALRRVLARPSWWRPVAAVNGVAVTVFAWHMTAWLVVAVAFEALGGTLAREPSAAWWLQRPLWVLLPGVVLLGTVAVVGRVERRRRPLVAAPAPR